MEIYQSAERWKTIASAYSAHLAVEQKGSKPIHVLTAEHGGYIYTVFGVTYGPWGMATKPYADAYKLLPVSMYNGETTLIYHDSAAIESGVRKRGDITGLIVSVKGELMVCAEHVRFFMDLPATRPLSVAETAAYEERQRKSGWRALWFESKPPEWYSLRGHPVAMYRGHKTLNENAAVLFWRHEGKIEEFSINEDVPLNVAEPCSVPTPTATKGEIQLSLF